MFVDHLEEITHLNVLPLHRFSKLVKNVLVSAEIPDAILLKLAHKLLIVHIPAIVCVKRLPDHVELPFRQVSHPQLLHCREEFFLVQTAALIRIKLLEGLKRRYIGSIEDIGDLLVDLILKLEG